ncbi:MAG: DNA-binding protein [Candidatus Aenigmatarchaeota archaeon]|nr:DNA-binding protein [Candidatus Aenigmarchaeota archaeon]
MRKAVLDTNFLISAVKWKIDFFSQLAEYKLYLVPAVVDELNKLAEGKGKDAVAARIALELVERLSPLSIGGRADAALLAAAKEGYHVATQDMALREKIRSIGGKVCYIRQKKLIVCD